MKLESRNRRKTKLFICILICSVLLVGVWAGWIYAHSNTSDSGQEEIHDVSYYSNLTFTVTDEDTKTMSVSAANDSITEAIIPAKVTQDGVTYTVTDIDVGFYNCTNLTSITIPDTITNIATFFEIAEDGYFIVYQNLTSLTAINVNSNNETYKSINGVLFTKDGKTLLLYPTGREGDYIIPNSVTEIEPFAFYHCVNLTSITIPNSVTSIG